MTSRHQRVEPTLARRRSSPQGQPSAYADIARVAGQLGNRAVGRILRETRGDGSLDVRVARAVGTRRRPPAAVQRDNELPTSQLDRDSIIETLAHEMVYEDRLNATQRARLSRLGFRALPLRHGPYGLQFRGFVDNGTGRDRFSVLAFRWTSSVQDALADAEAGGIGVRQLIASLARIRGDIRRMGGSVDVTGHSLGGALAQMAATMFPSSVRRVVTFNAPGIPAHMTRALEAHNRGVEPEEAVRSSHYRAEGDIVDDAGETHTPGEIIDVGADSAASGGAPLVGPHTRYVLSDLQRLRREHPDRYAQANVRVSGTGRRRRPVEAARRGAGALHGGAITGATGVLEWLDSDDDIRANLANDPSFLDGLSLQHRLRMLNTLLDGWVADEDLDAFETICRAARPAERAQIRRRIAPRVTSLTDLGQRTRLRLILSR